MVLVMAIGTGIKETKVYLKSVLDYMVLHPTWTDDGEPFHLSTCSPVSVIGATIFSAQIQGFFNRFDALKTQNFLLFCILTALILVLMTKANSEKMDGVFSALCLSSKAKVKTKLCSRGQTRYEWKRFTKFEMNISKQEFQFCEASGNYSSARTRSVCCRMNNDASLFHYFTQELFKNFPTN